MAVTFPNESAEYRRARDTLLQQEIDLRRQMEAVAVARRNLPDGGELPEDYEFDGLDDRGRPDFNEQLQYDCCHKAATPHR